MNLERNTRFEWVDCARAMAIIFVLIGHQLHACTPYFVFTSPIKIPLFFAITGYVFKDRGGDIKSFFKNALIKLVVPWLFLSLFPIVLFSFKYGLKYLFDHLVQIIIGNEIWYMPCCIIAEIIWFFVLKTSQNKLIRVVVSLIITVMGYFVGTIILRDSNVIVIAMVSQLFLLIGYLFHLYEDKISPSNIMLVSWIIIYIIVGILHLYFYPNTSLDVHQNRYPNILFSICMIIIGCLSVFCLLKRIKLPKLFVCIGQNTLIIYIWASYPIRAMHKIMTHIGLDNMYVQALIGTVCAIAFCLMCALIINRFVPVLNGRRKQPII